MGVYGRVIVVGVPSAINSSNLVNTKLAVGILRYSTVSYAKFLLSLGQSEAEGFGIVIHWDYLE